MDFKTFYKTKALGETLAHDETFIELAQEETTKSFSQFWKEFNDNRFRKSLSDKTLSRIRYIIKGLQEKNQPSSYIIKFLQNSNLGLKEQWKAERAYWTEVKSMETKTIVEAGEGLDIDKYRVLLSIKACQLCREKTSNGNKIFSTADMKKAGYGHVPPFHPSCYCISVPE